MRGLGGAAHGVIGVSELLPDGRGPLLQPRVRVLALQGPRAVRGAQDAVAEVCGGRRGRLLRGLRRVGHRARPQNPRKELKGRPLLAFPCGTSRTCWVRILTIINSMRTAR